MLFYTNGSTDRLKRDLYVMTRKMAILELLKSISILYQYSSRFYSDWYLPVEFKFANCGM